MLNRCGAIFLIFDKHLKQILVSMIEKLKNYRFNLLFILGFCTTLIVQGQTLESHPGYIISTDNDTINGIIEYKDGIRTVQKFMLVSETGKTEYNTKNASKCVVTNKAIFENHKIEYATNPDKIEYLLEESTPIFATKNVFIRAIILGKISLYEYVDDRDKKHYLIKDEKKQIQDLLKITYKKDGKIGTSNVYRRQLQRSLYNCQTCLDKATKVKFKGNSIKNLIAHK